MVAEIICVGTEILLGNIVNTNSAYLAKGCAKLGIDNYYQIVVGDNEERLFESIRVGLMRSDIVILSGGLGPTKDDLTKEVTAKVLGRELVEDAVSKEHIKNLFHVRGMRDISDNNWKQALVIQDSLVIKNKNGTAPGEIIKTDEGKIIILLPGPPNELIPMFENDIEGYLRSISNNVLYSTMIKICGIGESKAESMIQDLIDNQINPTIAPYAKTGEVHFRITAKSNTTKDAKKLVEPVVQELKKRFGTDIYTLKEEDTLESVVVDLLKKYKIIVSTAESCTGGLLAAALVGVPGVSSVYQQGFITYSNDAKEKELFVDADTLIKYGAVSKETAKEMAVGLVRATRAEVGIAITGIAGPDGGTDTKPVGLVYISICFNGKVIVKECRFNGSRQKVRESAVISALNLLRIAIIEEYVKL